MTDATRNPGPPFLPPERRRKNKLMLALTDAEFAALADAADAAGQYVSVFARELIFAALQK